MRQIQRAQHGGARSLIDRGELGSLFLRGAVVSIAINVAALVSPLFISQVYNRVLTSGSAATLAALTLIALVVVALGGALEQVRSVLFMRASAGVYADLEAKVYAASQLRALAWGQGRRGQPLDDLETVRGAISGPLMGALVDILFAPLFIAVLLLIHPWIGVFGAAAAALLAFVAMVTQWLIGTAMRRAQESQLAAADLAESQLRGAEAAAAMGFVAAVRDRWAQASRSAVAEQIRAAAQAAGLTSLGRAIRSGGQILIIAAAAALALQNQVSAGAIIASSIILARLLAPIDQVMGGWRQLSNMRAAWKRLAALLATTGEEIESAAPAPHGRLVVDSVAAGAPDRTPLLRGVSFAADPGEIVAVVGPVGAGKSTLLRCAVGVWPYMSGSVRLGGAPLVGVERTLVGPHIGYLPQNTDLFSGTVAENIRRFGPPDPEGVVAAAKAAGARDAIISLPAGFDTEIGEAGQLLSAGQRRLVALARALYRDPALVCLDEPEANLDRDGEHALRQALVGLKARGAVVLMAAHRVSVVSLASKVVVLEDGRLVHMGPVGEVLARLAAPNIRQIAP